LSSQGVKNLCGEVVGELFGARVRHAKESASSRSRLSANLGDTMSTFLKTYGLVVLLIGSAYSQEQPIPKAKAKTTNTVAKGATPTLTTEPMPFESKLASTVTDAVADGDDHVPCFFKLEQLAKLRPIPLTVKLSEEDESTVITALVKAVNDANEKEITKQQKKTLETKIKDSLLGRLVGKTRGEALATIMNTYYGVVVSDGDSSDAISAAIKLGNPRPLVEKVVEKAKSYGGDRFADGVAHKLDTTDRSWFRSDDPAGTVDQLSALIAQVPDDLLHATKEAANKTAMDLLAQHADVASAAKSQSTMQQEAAAKAGTYGGDLLGNAVREQLSDPKKPWFKPSDASATLNSAATLVEEAPHVSDVLVQEHENHKNAAGKLTQELLGVVSKQVAGSVADSARAAINKTSPPTDIGCAYQILSWKDARLIFGRSVANEFIAIQVTVRNLNGNEEFIVHNAEFAVDSDINGAVGQYFEGVDKLGVEAYNNAGESLTARGIVGNSISAATTLLSTLQPIVAVANFSNAVAAFNGGVPKGWAALEPDHQKEQLLMIANTGFSASDSLKTVVPKSSSATFFTWFPAKPFLQGWWLQTCAQKSVEPRKAVEPSFPAPADDVDVHPEPQVGVDKDRARRETCNDLKGDQLQTIPYQKWSSTSDQLFRDLSMAVVAGIHVREDGKNQSTISDLKCPKDAQGNLDLSKGSSNGTIGCDVIGQNLDKVTKLRLENAGNLVDPGRPEGVISEVGGDNATAKVTFTIADLKATPGDSYNVFAVGKDGTERAAGQKIYLGPALSTVSPLTLDLGRNPMDKLTLTGSRLGKIKKICLKGQDATMKVVSVDSPKTAELILDMNSSALTQGKWEIYFEDCATANDTNLAVTVSGTTPSVAGQPKETVKPKSPVQPNQLKNQKPSAKK